MGAWIEIAILKEIKDTWQSLPLWERGLKLLEYCRLRMRFLVAPLVGAWIEIHMLENDGWIPVGRSPCGSVD